MSEIDKYIKQIQDVVGDNWNTPKSRLYIAACFHEYENHLNKLSSAYAFEKEVNNRAREMIRDIFINSREETDIRAAWVEQVCEWLSTLPFADKVKASPFLEQFNTVKPIPENKGQLIKWRKPLSFLKEED